MKRKYSPRIRTFALTLHFYSPKGYRYVRSVFNNNLPSVSTIRKWYSSIDGKPGFSNEAFTALRCKANEANQNGEELLVSLVYDEMAIRKQEEYDIHSDTKSGLVNFGTDCFNSGEQKYAKEALVFLVAGINKKFKIPVAYFLIAGIKANEKAALIRQIILLISKTGTKVVGLVYDDLVTNISTARELGANFLKNQPYFENPHSDSIIFLFPDACHSLKTSRNRLGDKEVFYDGENNKIEWRYIEELEKYQRENHINLGNKITKAHIQWRKKRMSVRIAAETLSNSVADAIEFLQKNNVEIFQGSEATVKFIRRFNNIFDILNSKNVNDAICFKKPISPETKEEYFKYFEESIEYIKQLKLSPIGKSILKTKSKIAFSSFIISMKNFRSFYEIYVESGILINVPTFHFSQDHLELLFSCKVFVVQLFSYKHIFILFYFRYLANVWLQRQSFSTAIRISVEKVARPTSNNCIRIC